MAKKNNAQTIKDINGAPLNMTHNEHEALIGIIVSQYHDGNHPADSGIYTWDAIDNSGLDAKIVSGVWSSLVKKGWIGTCGEITPANDERTTWITTEGFHAICQTPEGKEEMVKDGHIEAEEVEAFIADDALESFLDRAEGKGN